MNQSSLLEISEQSSPLTLNRSISKLQKIQTLLRLNSQDSKAIASPIPQVNLALEILQKDSLLRTNKEVESVIQQFSNVNFFKNYLDDGCKSIIKSVLDRATLQQFKEDEYIYRKGDESNMFYIILQGEVGIYGQVANQKNSQNNSLIKVLSAGDSLGNIEIILNMKRYFSAKLLSDGQLLKIDKQTFNKYLRTAEEEKLDADFNFLENIQIFKGWSRNNLINISIDCISQKFNFQEQVYSFGQQTHSIYIIKAGSFGVYKQRPYWHKQDEQSIQNGVKQYNHIKIAKLNVLDMFGYDDIFLNSERKQRVICESKAGGELLVISKHNFITSILCHQTIKNYLIQKTKSDLIKPQRFIDDKPAIILNDNPILPTEEDIANQKQNIIRMSINNLSQKSTPKRGFSENKKKPFGKGGVNFPMSKTFYQNKTQSYSSLPQVNHDDSNTRSTKVEEEETQRPRLVQNQNGYLGNPLSEKKLPFLASLKQDKSNVDEENCLKLMIKENYFNRASAAYAHLFSHKLTGKHQNYEKQQQQKTEGTQQLEEGDVSNINKKTHKTLGNNLNCKLDIAKTEDYLNNSPLQQDPSHIFQQNNLNQPESGRMSTVTLFDSPVRVLNMNDSSQMGYVQSATLDSQGLSSTQKQFNRIRMNRSNVPLNLFSHREELDVIKQNHLYLSKCRFGNSLVNLQQLDEQWPTSSKFLSDNKFLSTMSPLLSQQSFKKLSSKQFNSSNNLN